MSSSLAVGKVAALATSFDPTTRVTSIAAWKINYQISNMGCGTARDVPCGSRRVTTVACRSEGGITTVLRTPSQVLPTDWKAYRGTSSSLHDREKFVTSTRLPRTEPGVGLSASKDDKGTLDRLTVSAATKVLLDAGVTYGDVDECFACFHHGLRISPSAFNPFGQMGAPICEVNNAFGLSAAIQSVESRRANCSLVVGIDGTAGNKTQQQTQVVAVVIVSDLFLASHAYLKDGAIRIGGSALVDRFHSRTTGREDSPRKIKTAVTSALLQARLRPKDVQILDLVGQGLEKDDLGALGNLGGKPLSKKLVSSGATTGFASLCGLVWQLRGWAREAEVKASNCLQLTADAAGTLAVLVLSRSDGRPALKWSEVENVRDGRERLGYNPAVEVRNISREDIEHVRARDHFVPASIDVKQLGFGDKGGDRAALARL